MAYLNLINTLATAVGIFSWQHESKILTILIKILCNLSFAYLSMNVIFFAIGAPLLSQKNEKLYRNLSISTLAAISLCKIYIFKKNLKILLNFINETEERILKSSEITIKSIFAKYDRINKSVGKFYMAMLIATAFSLIIDNINQTIAYNNKQLDFEKMQNSANKSFFSMSDRPMMFYYWLPFDADKHFILAFLYQFGTLISGFIINATEVLLFFGLMIFVLSHMAVFQHYIQENGKYIDNIEKELKLNRDAASRVFIFQCIWEHQKIIKYAFFV